MPLGREGFLGIRLLFLALSDQGQKPLAAFRQCSEVAIEVLALLGDVLADRDEFPEFADQSLGLMPHFRQHRTQHDGRAHRLQRIFRAHHQRRRGEAADPLQRRQHFGNHLAPTVERPAQGLLAVVERREAFLALADLLLDGAHAGGGIDQVLVELASVVADRFDVALELGLVVQRLALLGADRVEFLIALLQGVELRLAHWRGNGERRRGGGGPGGVPGAGPVGRGL